jgi:hypothetical protein
LKTAVQKKYVGEEVPMAVCSEKNTKKGGYF